jgi:hypothetical protein
VLSQSSIRSLFYAGCSRLTKQRGSKADLLILCNNSTAHRRTLGVFALEPERRIAMHTLPNTSVTRWVSFSILCAMVGAACLVERFPLLFG